MQVGSAVGKNLAGHKTIHSSYVSIFEFTQTLKQSRESIISGYNGDILAFADHTEQLIITDIDMSGAAKAREEKPYTSIRRPDFYE